LKQFSKNLNLLRTVWNHSQAELAEKFGVVGPSYSRWENGTEPKYETLVEIAAYFKISIDRLLTEELTPQTAPARWGGRTYPPQPVSPPEVVEDASHEEVAELKAMMSKLQSTVEAVVKQSNDLPAIRAELERLKAELSALRAVKKGGG